MSRIVVAGRGQSETSPSKLRRKTPYRSILRRETFRLPGPLYRSRSSACERSPSRWSKLYTASLLTHRRTEYLPIIGISIDIADIPIEEPYPEGLFDSDNIG